MIREMKTEKSWKNKNKMTNVKIKVQNDTENVNNLQL